MAEFAPPSYTGDPNSARCDTRVFEGLFKMYNIALSVHWTGLTRLGFKFKPTYNGELLLAVAEENANKRRQREGKPRQTRRQLMGKAQFEFQSRMDRVRFRNHL